MDRQCWSDFEKTSAVEDPIQSRSGTFAVLPAADQEKSDHGKRRTVVSSQCLG